ncbi:hypothetical protein E2C01_049908 [Portunus trituberculatus]|uniref:Uncharacterized protein n=1 Tax=Portunus trituberculatus TaxID=210409 RepID=A0A5B7G6U8_PORTR|nr:hypothetical protein [Portunus trituberculatus]
MKDDSKGSFASFPLFFTNSANSSFLHHLPSSYYNPPPPCSSIVSLSSSLLGCPLLLVFSKHLSSSFHLLSSRAHRPHLVPQLTKDLRTGIQRKIVNISIRWTFLTSVRKKGASENNKALFILR